MTAQDFLCKAGMGGNRHSRLRPASCSNSNGTRVAEAWRAIRPAPASALQRGRMAAGYHDLEDDRVPARDECVRSGVRLLRAGDDPQVVLEDRPAGFDGCLLLIDDHHRLHDDHQNELGRMLMNPKGLQLPLMRVKTTMMIIKGAKTIIIVRLMIINVALRPFCATLRVALGSM